MHYNGRTVNAVLRVLEPYAVKVARTVLRGERESNLPNLLDVRQEVAYYNCFTSFFRMIKPCVPSQVAYGHVHTG